MGTREQTDDLTLAIALVANCRFACLVEGERAAATQLLAAMRDLRSVAAPLEIGTPPTPKERKSAVERAPP